MLVSANVDHAFATHKHHVASCRVLVLHELVRVATESNLTNYADNVKSHSALKFVALPEHQLSVVFQCNIITRVGS